MPVSGYAGTSAPPGRPFGKLRVVTDPTVIEALLRPVEQVAEVTLKERAETLKFLRAYTDPVKVSEAGVEKSD